MLTLPLPLPLPLPFNPTLTLILIQFPNPTLTPQLQPLGLSAIVQFQTQSMALPRVQTQS